MMFNCFFNAYHKEILSIDKKNQVWMDLMVQIPKSTTKWEYLKEPARDRIFKRFFYDISVSKKTEIAVMSLTFLNLIVLAIDFQDSPALLNDIIYYINLIIIFIIILEVIVKIIGLDLRGYFVNNWNRFDFFIAITSVADLYFSFNQYNQSTVRILKNFQILRLLRMIRATR